MSVEKMTTLFACLTVVAAVIGIAAAGAAIVARSRPGVDDARQANATAIQLLATAIPLTAMLGSLYYSEIAHFPPCRYCWFQRIFMYSTAVIMVVAAIRRDRSIKPYAMTLTGIGGMISLYHVLLERNVVTESSSCDPNNPCTLDWLGHKWGGWITIPSMALVGFLATFALLALLPGRDLTDHNQDEPIESMEEV